MNFYNLNSIIMKKFVNFFTMSNTVKVVISVMFLSFFVFSFTMNDKVTICHIPPGNPGNCHEINVSMNAVEAHFDHHGDTFYCTSQEQTDALKEKAGNRPINIISLY